MELKTKLFNKGDDMVIVSFDNIKVYYAVTLEQDGHSHFAYINYNEISDLGEAQVWESEVYSRMENAVAYALLGDISSDTPPISTLVALYALTEKKVYSSDI